MAGNPRDSGVEGPIYNHDCEECTYLGSFANDEGVYDLYCCKKRMTTVIARWGHRPAQYSSGLAIARMGVDAPLTEAYKRAAQQGLISIQDV